MLITLLDYIMASMDLMDQSLPLSGPASLKSVTPPLNKSATIHQHMLPSLHEAKPLERFAQVKTRALDLFSHLLESLKQSQRFLSAQRRHPMIRGDLLVQMVDDNTKVVSEWVSQSEGIKEIISRRQMKIVFFGRTSNGKSTCINAMLRDQVLPTGFGHTTCCFCSVVGSEEREGFMELITSSGGEEGCERLPLSSVDQLVNALQDEKLDTGSIVRVHWPKERCELLAYDVELVDSPGVDIDGYTDEWIDKHCLDADVFVLVANSESTLMQAEKRFFATVAQRLSSPNVFILNNRWDSPAATREADKVRQQHVTKCSEFLVKELQSVDAFTARERVYFVSGKEAVEKRTSVKQEGAGDSLAAERYFEFERFESKLLECLSISAVRTKFSKHIQKGSEVVDKLEQLMREIDQQADDHLRALSKEYTESREYLQLLEQRRAELARVQQEEAKRHLNEAGNIVSAVCNSERGSLSRLADRYEQDFCMEQVNQFQTGLVSYIDEQLIHKLNTESSSQLTEFFKKIIDDVSSSVLPPAADRRAPESLGQDSVQNAKSVTFKTELRPDCAHLLIEFRPDLEFHFILSPTRLAPLLNEIGVVSLCASVARILPIGLTSLLNNGPSNIPVVLIVTMVCIAVVIQKFTSWKIVLLIGGGLSGFYFLERYCFTDQTRLGVLRDQLVRQLDRELRSTEPALVSGCVALFRRDLDQFLETLLREFDEEVVSLKQKISELDEEKKAMENLKQECTKLRNESSLLKCSFSKFRNEFIVK